MEIASFLESKKLSISVLPLAHYLNKIPPGEKFKKEQIAILEKTIKKTKPAVIGVSNQFTKDYPDCLKILKVCKGINKKITTVIGGPHVTFQDRECLNSPFVDVVVRGEGEWTMLDLLSSIKKGRDLSCVQGITFKKKGKFLRTPDRPLGDLNELPAINFDLLPFEFVQNAAVLGMLNRGCLANCRFCSEKIFWKTRRSFSTQRLIDEMKVLERKYKNGMKGIDDSTLSLGNGQFFELSSQLIKQKINIPFYFYVISRVDTITGQAIKALKEANIKHIHLGIESASSKVLKMMNKNLTFDQVVPACRKLRENKLSINSFWLIGHPGDNPQEAEYSLSAFKDLFKKDLLNFAEIAVFLPTPGTPFFRYPERYGIEIFSYNWTKWLQFTNRPICQLRDFSAGEISDFYRRTTVFLKSYLSLGRIINRMPGLSF